MKNEFYEYCSEIEISEPLLTEIRNMYAIARRLLDEEINELFISEYVDQGGVRNYQNIYFFSEDRLVTFVATNTTNCTVIGLDGLFPITQTSFENYDFREAKSASRLRIVLGAESVHGTRHQAISFSASGNNCDYLAKVYTKIILPHL